MSRSKRKLEHIRHAISRDELDINSFDEMEIIHQSLTDIHWDDISLQTQLGELTLSSPLFVNAMTGGGGEKTENINRQLAMAAKETGIALAVGSQMSALKDPREKRSYEVVREENPNGIIFANIGSEATLDQAKEAVDMLKADALQIHLNVLQELIMPEGDRDFTNRLQQIEQIVKELDIPVIIKEVGFGVSMESARQLKEVGVSYIDVGGKGGTNFSKVENKRRKQPFSSFNQWGVPTAISVKEVKSVFPECNVIASGGMRNGLDGAKAFVLGANAFGMAGHLLRILMKEDLETLVQEINHIHHEFTIAMMVLGAKDTYMLDGKPHIFTGRTKTWLEQRLPTF
ncbi:type 2 isopentenyl-diphosphate Delta-isomerase [Pontibacillus yanchengensis]|uniref:Isopentenyl-diphosphate delta-isomerase n=1 Tax=Pontibacillus yanchengensis Y32 TaxID=1385514 RepID=A0A0A2TB04_9BACI|nr:type 2 isopentenyl-diphosphate Delta-isomerase [Pontibacillus yanchengensis]KGP72997.1 isopentenyl pyrophosphate isomerase [Pontibacillus yanchengensis Y32]